MIRLLKPLEYYEEKYSHGLPDLQVPSPQGSRSENRNITKNPVRQNAYGTKI